MEQRAVITFETISNGKIVVAVATYQAPVLINALIRHTQWDMEQMSVVFAASGWGEKEDE